MKPIISLQCMRAVAAMLVVVFHHMNALRDRAAPDLPFFETGRIGVDIFFVISGFIMWTTTAARQTGGGEFLRRRIIRIVPLYWIFTLITAFVSTQGGLHFGLSDEYSRLAKSLLFIPQWSAEYDLVAPIMLVGWTLELEMLFYVIFACLLFLKPSARLWTMCAVLGALAAAGLAFDPQAAIAKAFTDSIVAEFALGLVLGRLHETGRLPASPALAGAMAVAAVVLACLHRDLPQARLVYFGLPALLIVAAALMMEKRISGRLWALPKFLGDASYSIYLSHLMAMAISWKLVPHALAGEFPWLVLFFQIVFAAFFGAVVYHAVERPVTDAARRALAPKPQSGPVKAL